MKKVNLTTATLAILAGVLTAPTITNAENSTETGTTIDAVEQVNTEAEEVESEETSEEATQDRGIVDEIKLAKQKEAAIKEINEMTELTDWEKAAYIAEIMISGSEGVSNTLEDARELDKERLAIKEAEQALAEAKENAGYTISQLYHDGKLSEDEAFEFLEEARNATDVAGVEAAIKKAEAKADENAANAEAEKALAEAKEKAEYAISQLYHDGKLSYDETMEFLEEARNATDVPGVEAAIKKAEDKAEANVALATAKEKAKAELKAALDEALKTTLKGRLTNSEKQNALMSIYEAAIKDIEAATSQEEIDAIVEAALKSFSEISSEKVDEVTNADDYVNSIYGGDLLTANQKDKLDNQIKEANSVQELDAVKRKAFRQGRKNAIAFAQRQLDAGNINQGDFDFFESEYNKLRYTGNMSDADAITAITAMMLELIEARQAAENTLALYLADGWITIDQYNKFIERINEVHTAEEVLKLMDLIAMAPDNERPIDPMDPDNERPIDPMDPDNERPVDPTPPGDNNDGSTGGNNDGSTGDNNDGSTGSGNHNKPNTITTSKPGSGNTSHSGGAASTGTASKGSAGQLPATGEEVRNGLIAGGLASVLGGAALFFRKPR